MTDRDEHLEKALGAMEAFDLSSIETGLAEITLSPLGELIETILHKIDPGELKQILERIRNMKQGTFEDLSDPEFQSFLTSYLRIDFGTLQQVTRVLRTHHAIATTSGQQIAMAARGSRSSAISDDELAGILSRRNFVDK